MMNIKKPLITRITGTRHVCSLLIAIIFLFTGIGYSADEHSKLRPALQFSEMGGEATKAGRGGLEPADGGAEGLPHDPQVLETKRHEQEKIERTGVAIRSMTVHGSFTIKILERLIEVTNGLDSLARPDGLFFQPPKEFIELRNKHASLLNEMKRLIEEGRTASREGRLKSMVADEFILQMNWLLNSLEKEQNEIAELSPRWQNEQMVSKYLSLMHRSIGQAIKILQSRIEIATESKSVELNTLGELLQNIVKEMWNIGAHHIVKIKNSTPESLLIKGNHLSLLNGIVNILKNAKFFTTEMRHDKAEVVLSVIEENNCVRIEIQDNGPGIPADLLEIDPLMNRPKLFNLNVSQREGGTGLGTTEAWYAIKDAGGTIEVASELGKGTTFTIRLPVAQNTRPKPTSNLNIKAPRGCL